jgi:hypothetical protein
MYPESIFFFTARDDLICHTLYLNAKFEESSSFSLTRVTTFALTKWPSADLYVKFDGTICDHPTLCGSWPDQPFV